MAKATSLIEAVKQLPASQVGRREGWETELAKVKPKVWAEVSDLVDAFISGDNDIHRKLPTKKHLWHFLEPFINDERRFCGEAGFFNMLRRRERANG
jgi:hypothetical protein